MDLKDRSAYSLLETLLWTPIDGYFLLQRHLDRMRRSADVLGFPWRSRDVLDALKEAARGWQVRKRVRLCLQSDGQLTITDATLPDAGEQPPVRIGLAARAVNSKQDELYHKTTNRDLYDRARELRPDCDDVVLYNEHGQVTESTIANLVIDRGNQRLTPPVSCGLLPGTYREHLLAAGEIQEGLVTLSDLMTADAIYLVNSVRRWMPAVLVT